MFEVLEYSLPFYMMNFFHENGQFELFMILESCVKKNCLVVWSNGYMFIEIKLSIILNSMFENYGYRVELALARLDRIPWELVKFDC